MSSVRRSVSQQCQSNGDREAQCGLSAVELHRKDLTEIIKQICLFPNVQRILSSFN